MAATKASCQVEKNQKNPINLLIGQIQTHPPHQFIIFIITDKYKKVKKSI